MKHSIPIQDHTEFEELLHEFLDGELPVVQQAPLFAHLAECPSCRKIFNTVMRFRRLSRQEHLPVPPAVDEEFFARLEAQKAQLARRDRLAERRPLWQARRLVSVRSAVVAGLLLLTIGLLAPSVAPEHRTAFVRSETERVEFRDVIYVIYPGLTVEAARL